MNLRPEISSSKTSVAFQAFMERKDQLLDSLENTFSKLSTDVFIHQMFHDRTSSAFIPDRICEIVRLILNNDREDFINNLLNRVKAFEACFGADGAQQIEQIGSRLSEISSSPLFDEFSYRKAMQDLKEQLKRTANDLPSENSVTFDDVSVTKRSLLSPLRVKACTNDIRKLQTNFLGEMRRARRMAMKAIAAANLNYSQQEEAFNDLRSEFKQRLGKEKERSAALKSELEKRTVSYERELEDLKQKHLSELESRSELQTRTQFIERPTRRSSSRQRQSETATSQRSGSTSARSEGDAVSETQDLSVITDVQAARDRVRAMQSDMEKIKRENGALRRRLRNRSRAYSARPVQSISEENLEELRGEPALSPIEQPKRTPRARSVSDCHEEDPDLGISSARSSGSVKSMEISPQGRRIEEEWNEEIDDNDAKIQELMDSILDKEKQVYQLTQAHQKQVKICDNLQNLNKKQGEEIDELRKAVLSLQQENLELKSSIDIAEPNKPSTSTDHEAQFDKEREKYRDEMARLQKTLTEQSMKISELGRVIDQLTFDKGSLERVIQEKENEVSFIKERTAKDTQDLRATILKTMEANGELNRRRVEAEELNKSLVRQLDGIDSLEEIPRKLWELRQESADFQAQLDSLKKLCGQDDVADFISNAKRQSAALRSLQAGLKAASAVNSNIPSVITEQLRELENESLTAKSSPAPKARESVSDEKVRKLREFEERESRIARLVKDYSFDKLPFQISELFKEKEALKAKIKEASARPPTQLLDASQVKAVFTETPSVQKKCDSCQKHEHLLKQIRILFSEKDAEKPVNELVSDVIDENSKMRDQISQIKSLFPDEPEDLVKAVSAVLSQNLELSEQHRVSSSNGNSDDLIKECSELKAFQKRMGLLAQSQDPNEIFLKAKERFDQASKISKLFPDSSDPSGEILNLMKRSKALENILQLLKCKEDDACQVVRELSSDFDATGRFLLQCLKTVTGLDDINIRLPPGGDVGARILAMLQNIRRKLEDSAYVIKEILGKASRLGYAGREVLEAVEYLEENAALNTRQVYSEQFHKEMGEVRALNAKVHDLAEKQRDKFKKVIEKNRGIISELQTTVVKKDEERNEMMVNLREQIHELEVKFGIEKRMKEELVRCIFGEVFDESFVIERFSTAEKKRFREFVASQKQSSDLMRYNL